MTKKHFEEAARLVRLDYSDWPPALRYRIAEAFARLFETFNPRFDRARFLKSCRLEED